MDNKNKPVQIKICGMRRQEDIEAVNAALPDYIGFICSDRFWRYIPMDQAAALKSRLDPRIRAVGVFVDEPAEKVTAYVKAHIIDMIQLHGHEDETYIRSLRQRLEALGERIPIIKAFKVQSDREIQLAEASSAELVLLDGGTGSGKAFNWNLIQGMTRPFFLAGGLHADNVVEAVSRCRPFAVDMSSGVESDRKKDPQKIKAAVQAVRALTDI